MAGLQTPPKGGLLSRGMDATDHQPQRPVIFGPGPETEHHRAVAVMLHRGYDATVHYGPQIRTIIHG